MEAQYIGIESLHASVKERCYFVIVTIQYLLEAVKGQGSHVGSYDTAVDRITERSCHPSKGTKKVYQSPRRILLHNGNTSAYERGGEKAEGKDKTSQLKKMCHTLHGHQKGNTQMRQLPDAMRYSGHYIITCC